MFYCQSCRIFYTDLINNPFNTTPKALSAPQLKKFLIAMKIADLFYAMRINFINSECIRHIVWLAQGLNLVPLILQIYHWFMQFNTHRFPSPRHCQNILLPIYIYIYIYIWQTYPITQGWWGMTILKKFSSKYDPYLVFSFLVLLK